MTTRALLYRFGVQIEHIHHINEDGTICVRLTQTGHIDLPVTRGSAKKGVLLPSLDTDMRLFYVDSKLKTIVLQGGDLRDSYELHSYGDLIIDTTKKKS